MAIYIIERKNGKTYHVIEGTCLVYDEDDAAGDTGKAEKVKKVKEKFRKIKDSPNTHYIAVEVTDGTTFMGGNTDTHI